MHISSSYAKILGGKLFRTWEIPRSGSKAKDGEKKEEKKLNDGKNNGQATHGARKHAWRMQAAWANCSNVLAPICCYSCKIPGRWNFPREKAWETSLKVD